MTFPSDFRYSDAQLAELHDTHDEQVRQFVESMPAIRDYYTTEPPEKFVARCDHCSSPIPEGTGAIGSFITLCEPCYDAHPGWVGGGR